MPVSVPEPEPPCRRLRLADALGAWRLREIDQPPVAAEIDCGKLRVSIDPKAADHQPLEMRGEEIGDVERAWLLVGESGERRRAGEEFVAMRACDALGSFFREHRVERAAGAAIAV